MAITEDLSELEPSDAPHLTEHMVRILILIAATAEQIQPYVSRDSPLFDGLPAREALSDIIADWSTAVDLAENP